MRIQHFPALMLDLVYQGSEVTKGNDSLLRRCIKLQEELGEVAEAWLSLSGSNHKKKTFDDLQEEVIDSFIVAVDVRFQFMLSSEQSPSTAGWLASECAKVFQYFQAHQDFGAAESFIPTYCQLSKAHARAQSLIFEAECQGADGLENGIAIAVNEQALLAAKLLTTRMPGAGVLPASTLVSNVLAITQQKVEKWLRTKMPSFVA